MVNIRLIVVGKLKEKYHKDEVDEYLKRLSKYAKVSVIEVNEEKIKDNSSLKEDELIIYKEGQNILKYINEKDYVFLLDLHGQEIDSVSFSQKLDRVMTDGYSNIDFVIGGSLGVSDELRRISKFKLKLSPMTFTHQMTRIIILEQIYRAFKIKNNETYHK